MPSTTPSATVIALNRSKREKESLFASETDVEHERRRAHRMLDGLTWIGVGLILRECFYLACFVAGLAWIVGWVAASLRAGVWL